MLSPVDLEYRKKMIGASDAPIIAGISPWKSPLQLYNEKLDLVELSPPNPAMQRGNELEAAARAEFVRLTGIHVTAARKEHAHIPYMMATFDGITDCGGCIVEIKCPGKKTIEMAKNGIIPDHYYCQIEHQIEVSQAKQAYYFCYDGANGYIIDVKSSKKYIDTLLEQEAAFYRCLMDFTPPSDGYELRTDDQWKSTALQWQQTTQELKILEKHEKSLRDTLIALSGKSNSRGAGLKLSREVRKGAISYPEIPEISNLDLEKYRKPSTEYWRITNENEKFF